ncbi:RNA-binding S4 domain-containing protein [Methylobacterium aerolatum]|uniref:Ribosome-associated heat shock protein Hsp15 n=1 Tax=Methylobacterium aerolatum TaxID=418708 RepID=A0ABU0HW08_9HYPH|nr:RNA-binding S4 domain-containing protein [Methylobacterium aerolatum]MDQ0446525.1 ribosome-associated heat shock protein Hsp15 [Methylobacterium aerolatum]GJD33313.1 Heat shock protein 15 [Methylobacterium aerolatum]
MRDGRQRLDKWLWFARFAKTRTLAARLVTDGHVRVNGTRTDNAAKGLALGDVVTVSAPYATMAIRVVDLGTRRGPAEEAKSLYAALSEGAE